MCDFPKYLITHVLSNRLLQQMQSHNSCRCSKFLHYYLETSSQIACLKGCKGTIAADVRNFSIKWFSNVFSKCLLNQMQSHISCMCVIFPNVSFHVSSQIAFLNICKLTLIVCLWFSRILVFHMSSQIHHINCMCAIFRNIWFHMSSQIGCFNRCKVTIVADVRNFSITI